MNRIILISPLIILFVICLFVLIYLVSGKNPNKPPSALLNKDTPLFKSVSLYDDNSAQI